MVSKQALHRNRQISVLARTNSSVEMQYKDTLGKPNKKGPDGPIFI
jgi:hypothetical protein